jgi:hypothetical protein
MGGSNSGSKPIIQQTPENITGASPSFRKSDFDGVIDRKGYAVLIDKAIKCPCRRKTESSALPSCKNCGGLGWVYMNRYQSKMVLQSMNIDTKYKEWAEDKIGSIKITCYSELKLGFYDRITVLNGVSISQELLRPVDLNKDVLHAEPKLAVRTIFPISEIHDFFYYTSSDEPLEQLTTQDFFYNEENGFIELNSKFNSIDELTLSIRYTHFPSFIVLDFPRDLMQTQSLDDGTSVEMPVHAIGRRTQYVLDLQNYDATLLLDNSYKESCDQIEFSNCSPAKFFNSDRSYQKIIPSGSEFVSEDISVMLANGTQLFPSNTNIDLSTYAPSLPVIIHNSDDSFTTSAVAGDDVELEDITITLGDGPQIFPSNIDINLSNYIRLTMLPSGIYVPKNIIAGPFDLLWEGVSSDCTSGTGFINRTSGSDNFESSGYFEIIHNGDFTIKWKTSKVGGAAYPMVGASYYKSRNYYANIDFTIYRSNDFHQVWENGIGKDTIEDASSVIEYSIQRTGLTITYRVNSTIIRTMDIINNGPMNFDTSFAEVSQVSNIEVIIP